MATAPPSQAADHHPVIGVFGTALLAAGLLAMPHISKAQEQWVVTTFAATDWLYHGTTETDNNPVIGANIEWQGRQNWFVGTQAQYARTRGVRQRERGGLLYGGYSMRATAKLDATVSVSRRLFFQSSKPWNSTEYALDLQHQNGLGLHISYSDNYYSHNTDSLVLAGRYRHLLSNHWSTTFEAGTVELSNTNWQDHTYAQVSLMHTRDRWAFEAMAHWNSQGSDENFGLEDYSDPGVALQISYRVW